MLAKHRAINPRNYSFNRLRDLVGAMLGLASLSIYSG